MFECRRLTAVIPEPSTQCEQHAPEFRLRPKLLLWSSRLSNEGDIQDRLSHGVQQC